MRLTVLGACGAWPSAGQACSGFLLEHENFRLVVDGVQRLLLTHLPPGTDPDDAIGATGFHGEVGVATADLTIDLH